MPVGTGRYGAPVENVYGRNVVATTGEAAKYAKTWNVVVMTYPHGSQFWARKPSDYLEQPVYSPRYQGYTK